MPSNIQTKWAGFGAAGKKPLRFSSFVVLLMASCVIHRATSNEGSGLRNLPNQGRFAKRTFSLKEPEYCPTEYLPDLKSENESNRSRFKIGDSATVHCHINHKWRPVLGNHVEVYPKGTRECLPGGVWSGPQPICAVKIGMTFHEKQCLVTPSSDDTCFDSSNGDYDGCAYEKSHVGSLNRPLPERTLTGSSYVETYGCVFSFDVSHFFSVVILKLAKTNGDLLNVTVLVDDEDRISNVSDEARNFQYKDFEDWYGQHRKDRHFHEYPVVNMSIYTNELVVYYSIIRNHTSQERQPGCGPANILFYRILATKYWNEDGDQKISQQAPPIIPNARATVSSDDGTIVRFQCDNGYILTKARTDEYFDGEVSFDGQAWNPYPLPVCKAVVDVYEKPAGPSVEDLEIQLKALQDRRQMDRNQQATLLNTLVYILGPVFGICVVLGIALCICKMKLHARSPLF